MQFIAENELEKALVAATHDPAAAPEFYRLFLESDLLVPGTVEGREYTNEKFSLTPDDKLNLVPGTKDGSQFLPLFSSLARMQEYVEQERKYLVLKGRVLLEVTRGAPVILNPASEYGKVLSPQQVAQLLDQFYPTGPIRAGATVYPADLVAALTALFATRADVETAWMIQGNFPSGAQRPIVGIEATGDWPSLMQTIQSAAQSSLPGLEFDVQRVDSRKPVGLTNAFLQTPPFYQRRPTGFTLN